MKRDGTVLDEKEWRKQNLAWERQRREAEHASERLYQRDIDERRARMELRQRQKDEDSRRRRDERTALFSKAIVPYDAKVKLILHELTKHF